MWQPLYPNTPEEDVPIGHITNGVHVSSWVAPQMQLLFDRHLGDRLGPATSDSRDLGGDRDVEDAELWETQQV